MIFDCDKSVAGPLTSGMTRADVRRLLGACSEFRKASFSVNTSDDFEEVGAHVFYSEDDVIRGVEIFRVGSVRVRGIEVFVLSLSELESALANIGISCEYDDVGARIADLGIGFYAPELGNVVSPPIEAVYIEMK